MYITNCIIQNVVLPLGVLNPFLLNNYLGPEYFCDRENETKTLVQNILNQGNTAFFAQRRLGKTALIQHAFHHLKKKDVVCLYLDIYATQSLRDLSNGLANAIYHAFPQKNPIGKRFWSAIQLLRPILTVDELSGAPELSLDITQPRQYEKSIPQLLRFLDDQNKTVVIAIDEFQQILQYPEKNVEALLRGVIQQLKNVQFIFCGSNQKMMHHIFNSAKRPFYASTKSINLRKISPPLYSKFITDKFAGAKISITQDAILQILHLTTGHTYYVQNLCHELFASGNKKITPTIVLEQLNKILTEKEAVFFQYRNLITPTQWNLLKAIGIEEQVYKPYAQDFIYKYKLGTSANVRRGIDSLLEKELIFLQQQDKEQFYEVDDKFLMRWLQHKI